VYISLAILVDEMVTLHRVGLQHAGVYQCLAHSDVSSVVTAGARLRVIALHHSHSQQSLNPHGQSPVR